MRASSAFGCVLLTGLAGLSAAAGEFLVDNGSIPGGGWSVSGWEQEYEFTQFQALTVSDAGGWNVTTIGIDGCFWDDPDGMGIIGTVLPDINGDPDEDHPIASASYFLSDDPLHSNWRDEEFDITLAQGSYWFRIAAGGPHLEAMIFDGVSGEDAFTRRGDGLETPHGPLAFRVAGTVVSEPCAGDLDGDGDTDHADLGILLADWGCADPVNGCAGDLDGDDDTDHADLGILLADWGCVP